MKELIELLQDIFTKPTIAWLGLIALAVVTAWAVYTFFTKGLKDASQTYYGLKLELCKEVAQVTATIATSIKADEIRSAAFRFDALYWGQLVLVEDRALEAAMVSFRSLIASSETDEIDVEKLADIKTNRSSLRSGSLAVAHACFNLLQPRWFDQVKAFFRTPQKGSNV
jgi:hypothetical protein